VTQGDHEPVGVARGGSLYVQGACDAVWWSNGVVWTPVETTATTGHLRLAVLGAGRLVTTGGELGSGQLTLDGSGLRYAWLPAGAAEQEREWRGRPVAVGNELDILFDRSSIFFTRVTVRAGSRVVLDVEAPVALEAVALGPSAEPLPTPTPLCDRLVDLDAVRR
jgi:hypothetical protein